MSSKTTPMTQNGVLLALASLAVAALTATGIGAQTDGPMAPIASRTSTRSGNGATSSSCPRRCRIG